MKKITILTALLLTTLFLHSQNLKRITVEECSRSEIRENYCANYDSAKYDYATIVFNTNLPELKFEIVNAYGRLIYQKPEIEKNRYILCVEPMGDLYSTYRIEISGKEIFTTNFVIENIIQKDKRFFCIFLEETKPINTEVKKSQLFKKNSKILIDQRPVTFQTEKMYELVKEKLTRLGFCCVSNRNVINDGNEVSTIIEIIPSFSSFKFVVYDTVLNKRTFERNYVFWTTLKKVVENFFDDITPTIKELNK